MAGLAVAEEITIDGVPTVWVLSTGRVDKDGRAMKEVKVSVGVCWFSLSLLSLRARPYKMEVTYDSGETIVIPGGLHDPLNGASILLQSVTNNCDYSFPGFDVCRPNQPPSVASFRYLHRISGDSAIGSRSGNCVEL
jgi:hypothetical protein